MTQETFSLPPSLFLGLILSSSRWIIVAMTVSHSLRTFISRSPSAVYGARARILSIFCCFSAVINEEDEVYRFSIPDASARGGLEDHPRCSFASVHHGNLWLWIFERLGFPPQALRAIYILLWENARSLSRRMRGNNERAGMSYMIQNERFYFCVKRNLKIGQI